VGAGGAPGGPGVGAPQQYPPVGGQIPRQNGWTPPPRPGLIPLQPMTLGTILAGSFQVMRRNPRPTFGVSLLINGIIAVVSIAAVALSFTLGFDRIASATSSSIDDITAGSNALSLLSSFVTAALSLVGSAILQGIMEVARATIGDKLTARQLFRLAKGRIAVLIGWSILLGLALIIGIGVVVGIIVVLALSNTTAGIVAAVLVGLAALLGGLVLGSWIGTRLSLVPSVLLIERSKLFPALRRSWSLTTGYFWRTLGIQLLVNVIVVTASQIIILPITVGIVIYSTVTNPTADAAALDSMFFTTTIITTIAASLIGSVTAIILSATSALIYIDLRMRKEGLDLTLVKYAEARQGGGGDRNADGTLVDPYRTTPTKSAGFAESPAAHDSPWA
jgi:hypothetical protein